MSTRTLLVTSCLVAMATLVTSQCDQFPSATKQKPLDIKASLSLGEGIGLIGGIAGFALLVSLLYIAVRSLAANYPNRRFILLTFCSLEVSLINNCRQRRKRATAKTTEKKSDGKTDVVFIAVVFFVVHIFYGRKV